MGYFDDEDNVREYLHMADGYDGRELIDKLHNYLPAGKTVLEIGMGPGKDLDLLCKYYNVTGSDNSDVFLDLYRKQHPDADLLNLDAVTLDTDRTFDCIFSNKVLHHLKRKNLLSSLEQQLELLNDGGIIMHTFWSGSGEETHHGLLFTYYDTNQITNILPKAYAVLNVEIYQEMEKDDSILLIARKTGPVR